METGPDTETERGVVEVFSLGSSPTVDTENRVIDYNHPPISVSCCPSRTGARRLKVGGRRPVTEPIELKLVDCNL